LSPKIIHTRRLPDPNPPKVVENPERILRRSSIKVDKGIFHLQKSLSLPTKSVKSIENIVLNKETDQALLISKFAYELSQVTVGPERLNFSRPSQPSPISLFFQNQTTQIVHVPVTYPSTFVVSPLVHIPLVPNPPRVMAFRFTTLVLLD
jgi:hypothetical protein